MCNWSSDLYFLSNIQILDNQLFSEIHEIF